MFDWAKKKMIAKLFGLEIFCEMYTSTFSFIPLISVQAVDIF